MLHQKNWKIKELSQPSLPSHPRKSNKVLKQEMEMEIAEDGWRCLWNREDDF